MKPTHLFLSSGVFLAAPNGLEELFVLQFFDVKVQAVVNGDLQFTFYEHDAATALELTVSSMLLS